MDLGAALDVTVLFGAAALAIVASASLALQLLYLHQSAWLQSVRSPFLHFPRRAVEPEAAEDVLLELRVKRAELLAGVSAEGHYLLVDGEVDEGFHVFVEVAFFAQDGRREVAHFFLLLASQASNQRKGRVCLSVVLAHGALPGLQTGCEVGERSDAVQGKHGVAVDHETESELGEVLEGIGYCRQLQVG